MQPTAYSIIPRVLPATSRFKFRISSTPTICWRRSTITSAIATRLNGEYFFGTGNTYSSVGSPVQPYWGSTTPVRGQGFTVVDVWTPNSTWVNEARGGYHRYDQVIGIGECVGFGAPPATGKSDYVGYTDGSPNYPSVVWPGHGNPRRLRHALHDGGHYLYRSRKRGTRL